MATKVKKEKCLMCGDSTKGIVGINYSPKPLCNPCATAIMLQQAAFLAQQYSITEKKLTTK